MRIFVRVASVVRGRTSTGCATVFTFFWSSPASKVGLGDDKIRAGFWVKVPVGCLYADHHT